MDELSIIEELRNQVDGWYRQLLALSAMETDVAVTKIAELEAQIMAARTCAMGSENRGLARVVTREIDPLRETLTNQAKLLMRASTLRRAKHHHCLGGASRSRIHHGHLKRKTPGICAGRSHGLSPSGYRAACHGLQDEDSGLRASPAHEGIDEYPANLAPSSRDRFCRAGHETGQSRWLVSQRSRR